MLLSRLSITFLAVPLIGLLTASAAAQEKTLLLFDGSRKEAALTRIDASGEIGYTLDGEEKKTTLADIVSWGACVEPRRAYWIVTADGGLLVAEEMMIEKDILHAESRLFGKLELPVENVSGIMLKIPGGRLDADLLFDRIVRAKGSNDLALLENGDELSGTLESMSPKGISWQSAAGTASASTSLDKKRVAAVIFNPELKKSFADAEKTSWTAFADGSRLKASSLALQKDQAAIKTAGITLKTTADKLLFLQPLAGRASYLSDRAAVDYRAVPYLSITWPYERDRNVMGGILRADERLYLKGIGLHAAARLTYALDGTAKSFQAEARRSTTAPQWTAAFGFVFLSIVRKNSPATSSAAEKNRCRSTSISPGRSESIWSSISPTVPMSSTEPTG